ncbi:MAG: hypothetical protein MUF50_01755 [Planctomycetes bacterium]|nr:hypothetical protein [Planctomycetota bacterium]
MERIGIIKNILNKDSKKNYEFSSESREDQNLAKEDFFNALEKTLIEEINEKSPELPIPETRTIEHDNRKIAEIEQVRKIEKRPGVPQDLWLVVDFDDVINHTSTYKNDLQDKISQVSSITKERIGELYDQSKVANETGRKVFRFNSFIENIKEEAQNKKDAEINDLIKDFNYESYIDQSVKRTLIACRFLRKTGYSSSVPATVRISVLTYGDPEYQKFRVNKSGISNIVDEIIYTEGSKREVIDTLTEMDYEKDSFNDKFMTPYLITFDDSPEQIDDLDNLENNINHINVRFCNPQAKKYKDLHSAKEVVKSDEDALNQAALDMFTIARVSLTPETHQLMSSLSSYDYTKDRKLRERILSDWGANRNDNVVYEKDGDSIIRSYDNFSFSHAINDWRKFEHKSDKYTISSEGTLELRGKTEILEEYIKGAKNVKKN